MSNEKTKSALIRMNSDEFGILSLAQDEYSIAMKNANPNAERPNRDRLVIDAVNFFRANGYGVIDLKESDRNDESTTP